MKRAVPEAGRVGAGHDNPAQRRRPTLGAPQSRPKSCTYVTAGKVIVIAEVEDVDDDVGEFQELRARLDSQRGCLLSSSYEYPGRYTQWSLGFVNPPLCLEAWGRHFRIKALCGRGLPFLGPIVQVLGEAPAVAECKYSPPDVIEGTVREAEGFFPEEQRSKQPSIFAVIRALVQLFSSEEDKHLGLYGAFGFDLAFQFEDTKLHQKRNPEQRDLVLYLPDELLVTNHQGRQSWRVRYDFVLGSAGDLTSTKGLERHGAEKRFEGLEALPHNVPSRELQPGEFAKLVDVAKRKFECGDLFEAVLSQTFREPCKAPPSAIFKCLQQRNPSPYGFLINLGEQEYLVGASPEMFVRVERNLQGLRVETCPISGTIRRGKDALEDAENIKRILADPKEESEITMCTDVDRNDKSRICEHGTVHVIGRRQIEMYSKLMHTVDHVEGYLRPEFDALDAFLVHMWAVTVCGAPKTWALQFVEESESSQRCWYGAAVGHVAFDGHLNTGLTLRTVRISGGVAEVRAGATLLFDSVPESEEQETELKAAACLGAVRDSRPDDSLPPQVPAAEPPDGMCSLGRPGGEGPHILLIDFDDSFVHTLANYLRQTGAMVTTVRHTKAQHALGSMPTLDLAVLSPGPGKPVDFGISGHLQRLLDRGTPIFGVCLGLQGIVEHFGGVLAQLRYPMHGKPSTISVVANGGSVDRTFEGLPHTFTVARYHSLYARRPLPECLTETACIVSGGDKESVQEDNIVMAVRHRTLPVAAVQFHPESILTSPQFGLQILSNSLRFLVA